MNGQSRNSAKFICCGAFGTANTIPNDGGQLRQFSSCSSTSEKDQLVTGRLAGKTALVTATAQGIGRACAEAFAAEATQVLATDIDEAKLANLAGIPGTEARRPDVLDLTAIQALAAEIPAPSVLLNCAGFVHHGSVPDASDQEWNFGFGLNIRSQFWIIRTFLPGMIAGGGGSIVNMASVSGLISGSRTGPLRASSTAPPEQW